MCCVRENRVGQSPLRPGGTGSQLSKEDLKLIFDLVFTCQSIKQANGEQHRLGRPKVGGQS